MATILVIDDEPVNRQLLNTVLGYQGHTIVEAGDGEEGLEKSRATHPDLAIVDILMPTMDGFEFVRQLRSDASIAATPIIFYTAAYYEREIRSLAQECGVFRILTKPTDPEIIIAAVKAALSHLGEPAHIPAPQEFDREHLRLMTNKLSQKVSELEAVGLRLARLIEISRDLAAEHKSNDLIRKICRSAREIIGAAQAAVGITDETGTLVQFECHGISAAKVATLVPSAVNGGIIYTVLSERRPVKIRNAGGDPKALGFPADHPAVYSFLGVPIYSPAHRYGWLGLTNKIGADEFSVEDEHLAVSLAAQTAVAYENLQRYGEIRTHAEKLEQQVNERTAELKRSNAELEQFAYVASHDLQEPLRKITGFTQLFAERWSGKTDTETDEFVEFIVTGAQRMRELIQDILVYSRVGHRKERTVVDCEEILGQALGTLQLAIHENNASVTHDPLPKIIADGDGLRQLLLNLIGNAIKFHGAELPRIHVSATLKKKDLGSESATARSPSSHAPNGHAEMHRTDDTWLFSVRDNGIGIEPRYADRIFRVFQRLHRKEEYPGTGIGLAICKKVVESHGGRIWIESNLGPGAIFRFSIPHMKEATKDGYI